MPGLALYEASRSAAIYRRSRELIEHDDVVVIAGLTPGYEVRHLGRTLNMKCGEAVILTGAEPASFGGPAQNSVSLLRVPVRLLSPLVADLDKAYGRSIPADNPALQLLTRYLGILQEAGTFAVPELRRQAVVHIHDLIALAIGVTRDAAEIAKGRGARAARLPVIKEDIVTRLDQPGPVGGDNRRAPSDQGAANPATIRKRRHDLHRVRAGAAPYPRAPAADESPPCRPEDQQHSARCRVRGSIPFQSGVSPALWHGPLGLAYWRKVGQADGGHRVLALAALGASAG